MPRIHCIIHQHWLLLRQSYPSIPEFHSPLMICTERPPNLHDTLIKANIGPTNKESFQSTLRPQRAETFHCVHCAHCFNIIKGDNLQYPRTGTYDSSYVVYLLKCPCGFICVGETSQRIKDRIASHKSTIHCNKIWLPLPHHFKEVNHNVSQLHFQIIEHVPHPRPGSNHIKLLICHKSYWIHCLDSMTLRGLNREFDFLSLWLFIHTILFL